MTHSFKMPDSVLKKFDLVLFKAAQAELMSRGKPDDPCGECGCKRKHHLPKPTYSYAKTGGSSGKSVELPCYAPISCDCPRHMCSCVSFREEKREVKKIDYGLANRKNRTPFADTAEHRRTDAVDSVPSNDQQSPSSSRTSNANARGRKRSKPTPTEQGSLF